MRWNARILLLVTAVAVAVGLAGCGQSTGSAQRATARKAPDQATVRVLRDASAVVSRVPPRATPNPGQWIYSKVVRYEYPKGHRRLRAMAATTSSCSIRSATG
jgi:hypothetical protein